MPCNHAQSESLFALPWRLTVPSTVLQPGSEGSANTQGPWSMVSKTQVRKSHRQKCPRKRFSPYGSGQHESRPTAPVPREQGQPAIRNIRRGQKQSRA